MPLPTTTLTPPTTNIDFSKIFSSNSPLTPFTWLDRDYLTGWQIVGSTPPARTQFDALQRMTDEKLKALKGMLDYYQQYDAFLKECIDYLDRNKVGANSPTFTGDPKAPTPPANDNDTSIATTAFVQSWVRTLRNEINSAVSGIDLSAYAKLASPSFSGTPKAPTPSSTDKSTRIATTAFVQGWVDTLKGLINNSGSSGGSSSGSSNTDAVTCKGGMVITTGKYYIKFGDKALIQFTEAYVDSTGMARCSFPTSFWSMPGGMGNYIAIPIHWHPGGYGEAYAFSVGATVEHRKPNFIDVYVLNARTNAVAVGQKVGVFAFGMPA